MIGRRRGEVDDGWGGLYTVHLSQLDTDTDCSEEKSGILRIFLFHTSPLDLYT